MLYKSRILLTRYQGNKIIFKHFSYFDLLKTRFLKHFSARSKICSTIASFSSEVCIMFAESEPLGPSPNPGYGRTVKNETAWPSKRTKKKKGKKRTFDTTRSCEVRTFLQNWKCFLPSKRPCRHTRVNNNRRSFRKRRNTQKIISYFFDVCPIVWWAPPQAIAFNYLLGQTRILRKTTLLFGIVIIIIGFMVKKKKKN